jgi:anti-sigma factor RsiW
MNCSEANYVIPLYLSSELDTKVMAEFELHLQRCAMCAREVEQLRLNDDLLRNVFARRPLDIRDLRARFWSQISISENKRLRFRRPVYMLPIAALLLLTIGAGIIYFTLPYTSSQTVYASAVDDHTEEVVQRAPINGWRETPEEIEKLLRKELGDSDVMRKLAPADYKLARARLCDLGSEQYVHLVYKNEQREISIYIRPKGSQLPGAVVDTVNGCTLHAESAGRLEVAGYQSEKFTVLIVSDLPRRESLRLAHEAAEQIA